MNIQENEESYTIVHASDWHYDTNEAKFVSNSWDRTQDKKEYLEQLIKNDPEKFKDCRIENNSDQ